MSRDERRGDIVLDDVETAIIWGETKEPEGGLPLETDSRAVVEPALRCRSERLRVTMLCGFREETTGFGRPEVLMRKGWLTSDRELVRWLASEGRRG